MDFIETSKDLISKNKAIVNASEWADDWQEYYVIFADLIAFAQRCLLSTGITLNNIVRFHRAIDDALSGIEEITKYQFKDACYILTKDSKTALIVASNIQNECLLHNYVQIKALPHPLFYQMIVPKVVISKGEVLTFKDTADLKSLKRLSGISASDLLAGDGIVKAYYLEKKTTGGLVSVDKNYIGEFKKYSSGESKIKTNSLFKQWKNDAENKLLGHDGVVDIPWLALQPRQTRKGILNTESTTTFKEKVSTFNHIWRTNFTEHLTEGTSTETLKQYDGGISHLCELLRMYTNAGPRSWDLIDLTAAIDKI